MLDVYGFPRVGDTLLFQVRSGGPNASVILALGFADPGTTIGSCRLFTSADLVTISGLTTAVMGDVTTPYVVATTPSLHRRCDAMMMIRSVFSLGALALALQAQGSYTLYGSGCGSYGSPPQPAQLWASGPPVIGKAVRIHWLGPHFPRFYQVGPRLLLGASNTTWKGVPLPIRVIWGSFGSGDCMIWTSMDVSWVQPAVARTPTGYADLRIPNDPSLVGATVYQQWLLTYVVTGTPVLGFNLLSNGGAMTIGFDR